jgi:hypothetical protein
MRHTTRFAVFYRSQERELFKVVETPDGSLLFCFRAARSSFGDEGIQDVREQRVSAHSPKAHIVPVDRREAACKIKYTTFATSGAKYESSLIVTDRKRRGFLWPVLNVLTASLEHPNALLRRDGHDTVVELFGYRGMLETLLYTIYVAEKSLVLPPVQGFTLIQHPFTYFSVAIYTTFFTLPTPPHSLVLTHVQGARRKDEQPVGAKTSAFVPRMTENGVERYLREQHGFLASMYNLMTPAASAVMPDEVKKVLGQPRFLRWPLDRDETHDAYGTYSRQKLPIYSDPFFVDGTPKPSGYRDPPGPMLTARPDEAAPGSPT